MESDGSPVESLDLKGKVPGHWNDDNDDNSQYQFYTEEEEINAESEQPVSSNLWHFQENSTGNDFKDAFGSTSENNGQFLEARSTVRAAMGELSHSDTSSDILSVITEDTEPSETSTRSWDSGGKCSTVKAASGFDSDCDRTMERIPIEMIPAAPQSTNDVDTKTVLPVEETPGQVTGSRISYTEDTDVTAGYHSNEVKKDEPKEAEIIPEPGTLLALINKGKKPEGGDTQRHLEPEVTIRDAQQLDTTVSKKVYREKFVKQWLEAEVHSSEGPVDPKIQNSARQMSDPQSTNDPSLNPYHTGQSSTPGTHPLGSTQIPGLPIGSLADTEKDIPPKLSPRASSEGSGSLEDSGHVSGTSTQDNTPEHRRTDSIQSQMSVPSTLSTVTDVSNKEDDSEADIDELVASHKASTQSSYGSSRGNLLSTVADSRESIASFYSDAGGVNYGKVPITGEIQFGLDYNYRTGSLEIAIRQCKDLAPADPKRHRSDPYVKTYLLPDKTRGGKRKTRVKKNTICPIFDETLRYLISKSEVENRILWVTVWHNDRFGRNDFLGEVSINFDYFRFGDSAPKWYTLQERVETQTTSLLTYQGDLILSLRLVSRDNVKELLTSPTKTKRKKAQPDGQSGFQLQVLVKEARNLTAVRSNGFSDPFCKAYLLPDKSKGLKQKTPVIKRDCNPKWNYKFIFDDVSPDDLKERGLELTIWDYDKISSNDFLGGVRLSLGLGRSYGKIVDWNDAKGEEISIWQAMLDRPDSWIDGTLILRPNMDKRRY
ncbi:synaptotagmin-like protein 5 isoform X3 [Pecten maximus]|uniref:synaptotagmin-like protein 5 isoform X3 n=1 Tax=Pecten maximus TaxID=6579 RepID=UPI0014585BC9|nr:synaptotagmin-like protein 5 isoform X3 [Pecten maximus]